MPDKIEFFVPDQESELPLACAESQLHLHQRYIQVPQTIQQREIVLPNYRFHLAQYRLSTELGSRYPLNRHSAI